MICTKREEEVIYASRIPAEIEIAKIILNYLGIKADAGISADGSTIHLNRAESERFEREVREWKTAIDSVHNSF